MRAVYSYFDLTAGLAERRIAGPTIPERPPVLPQYVALVLGVIAAPFVHQLILRAPLRPAEAIAPLALGGLALALLLFPPLYRNAFDPDRPILAQLGAIFASGIGWQSLFRAATG